MKRTAVISLAGALVLASACCFLALAQPPGPPPLGGSFFGGPPGLPPHGPGLLGGPPGPPPPPGSEIPDLWSAPPDLIEKLKLTDDQLKQLRLGFVEFKEKTRKARNALMAVRDEKETMLLSGKIDQAKLAKLDEETTKLASEVMAEHLKIKREQLSKLTPEQLERLPLCLGKGRMPHGPKMTAKQPQRNVVERLEGMASAALFSALHTFGNENLRTQAPCGKKYIEEWLSYAYR